jgi:hypothetical protein
MENLFALLILASLALLVIGFFSPATSLFWYQQERTRKKSALIYGIAFIASFILFGFTSDKDKSSNSSDHNSISSVSTFETPMKSSKSKQWIEVYTFKGNGMKKSPAFTLTGGEARLKYNYKAEGGIGMGMFAAYVVDEGRDIMKTGGFPEVMTQAENEESETALHKGSGRYYLNINAAGSWVVTVEEFK